jgi:hypothetical protein
MEQPYNSSFFDEEFARFGELPLQSTLRALHVAAKNAATDFSEAARAGMATGTMPELAGGPGMDVLVIYSPNSSDGDCDGDFRRFAVFAARSDETEDSQPKFELWYQNGTLHGEPYFELRADDRLCTECDAKMLMGWDTAAASEAA